jgi:hypothetical protein
VNGQPVPMPIEPSGSLWGYPLFIATLSLAALWFAALFARSYFSGKSWENWHKARKQNKAKNGNNSGADPSSLYDKDIEEKEHKRLNEKVL